MTIILRYRDWDFNEWTEVSCTGPSAFEAFSVIGSWAFRNDFEVERWDEDAEEWINLAEEGAL